MNFEGARIGIRPSDDRKRVVILFGDDEEAAYYASVSPQKALAIAARLTKAATEVLEIREQETLN